MHCQGAVAQLGERRLCKPEVEGSIPFGSIFFGHGSKIKDAGWSESTPVLSEEFASVNFDLVNNAGARRPVRSITSAHQGSLKTGYR